MSEHPLKAGLAEALGIQRQLTAAEAQVDLTTRQLSTVLDTAEKIQAERDQLQARVAELESALKEIYECKNGHAGAWTRAIAQAALQQEPSDGRKPGHSKLVYDKATRTIVDEGTWAKRLSLPLDGGDGE